MIGKPSRSPAGTGLVLGAHAARRHRPPWLAWTVRVGNAALLLVLPAFRFIRIECLF